MTLEEACLILGIKDKTQLNKEFVLQRHKEFYEPTKGISTYLADRIDGAAETILTELGHTKP